MTDDELSKTDKLLREATTEKLEQSKRLYAWVIRLSLLALIVCALLGIWVDYRWLWTALVPMFLWTLANLSDDKVRGELRRRAARKHLDERPDTL